MTLLKYEIIEAGPEWADKYRLFCRKAYLDAYVRPNLGINKEQFSKKVFNSPRVVEYFRQALESGSDHQAWLAIDGGKILGGVAAYRYEDKCEMQTFYVHPNLKGCGIGHALYQKVLVFSGSLPIQVDVLRYMQSSIDMYKHWGFKIDESKGEVQYQWIEWPTKARQSYKGIYMVKPGK